MSGGWPFPLPDGLPSCLGRISCISVLPDVDAPLVLVPSADARGGSWEGVAWLDTSSIGAASALASMGVKLGIVCACVLSVLAGA